MNRFNVGDWVKCVDSGDFEGCELTNGRLYQIRWDGQATVSVINDRGVFGTYYISRFELYQTQEKSMPEIIDKSDTVLAEKYIKEFLKKLEYVLVNDDTISDYLEVSGNKGELTLTSDIVDITGVDDIYTYINNSYDQLKSQAAQKRKLELLDKKAKLDLELSQINSELEGL